MKSPDRITGAGVRERAARLSPADQLRNVVRTAVDSSPRRVINLVNGLNTPIVDITLREIDQGYFIGIDKYISDDGPKIIPTRIELISDPDDVRVESSIEFDGEKLTLGDNHPIFKDLAVFLKKALRDEEIAKMNKVLDGVKKVITL
jgi:hypothetical protein